MTRFAIIFIFSIFFTILTCNAQHSYCFDNRILIGVPDSILTKMSFDINNTQKEGYDFFIELNKGYHYNFFLRQKKIGDTSTVELFNAQYTNIGIEINNQFIPVIRNEDSYLIAYYRMLQGDKDKNLYFAPDEFGIKLINVYYLAYKDIEYMRENYQKKK